MCKGRYGLYIKYYENNYSLGELLKKKSAEDITLRDIKKLVQYPKVLGICKDNKISLHMGKYGIYMKFGLDNVSLKDLKDIKPEKLTLENARLYK